MRNNSAETRHKTISRLRPQWQMATRSENHGRCPVRTTNGTTVQQGSRASIDDHLGSLAKPGERDHTRCGGTDRALALANWTRNYVPLLTNGLRSRQREQPNECDCRTTQFRALGGPLSRSSSHEGWHRREATTTQTASPESQEYAQTKLGGMLPSIATGPGHTTNAPREWQTRARAVRGKA